MVATIHTAPAHNMTAHAQCACPVLSCPVSPGEMDIYKANCEALAIMSGAEVGAPLQATYNGIPVEEWPRVVLSPAFAPCLDAVKVRLRGTVGGDRGCWWYPLMSQPAAGAVTVVQTDHTPQSQLDAHRWPVKNVAAGDWQQQHSTVCHVC